MKDDNSLLSESCYFDSRSINDYLLSTYYDCTVYSHSLTNKKKIPTSNARWYLWGKIIFYRMLYESTSGHVKLFIPMTLRNLKFIIDYFIKTKITIWSMVHSTLRKVTTIHKIKADSLTIWKKSQKIMVCEQPKT